MEIDQKFHYHSTSTAETADKLQTDPEKGLSSEEVEQRKQKYGRNILPEKGKKSALVIFFKQFKDLLILILFIAAVISFYIGEMVDVYVIIGVILFNAIMGFVQEFKAEKAIESIKKMVEHEAIVTRDGETLKIKATEVVPGDLIHLQEGQTVPADARLLSVKNLRTIEAALTGESVPSGKNVEEAEKDAPVADRKNMVYKGTQVARGTGKALVTATGKNTEMGKIASSLSEMEKTSSAFKGKTNKLSKQMAIFAVTTSLIVFLVGYFGRDFPFNEILLVTIAALVSSIPEGLPVVISIVLAIGAKRMAKRNAIIRNFGATEMLGSVTTILTDKTGTITQNVLTIQKMFINKDLETEVSGKGYNLEGEVMADDKKLEWGSDPRFDKTALIAALCNNSELEASTEKSESEDDDAESEDNKVSGDPTEVALLVLSKKVGVQKTDQFEAIKVVDDLPFHSEEKFRATLVEFPDGRKEIFVVGAPEKILDRSSKIITADGPEDIDDELRSKINGITDDYTSKAMRVVALGYRPVDERKEDVSKEDVKDLIWVALTGMMDPPRKGVKEAIGAAKDAGIRIVMLTGDHKKTAKAIAQEVGIVGEEGDAVSAKELNDGNFKEIVESTQVFARVDPNTKLKIAQHLIDNGELVGMTGDGVNDAPALKKADVGIAMGKRGTDVAKDSSEIVLSDDNFSTIVKAIEEGRIVFKNIRNTSFFLLTTNFASVLTIIVCILIGFPLPLLATQILFVNMVTDGVMDVALATEPGHGDVMKQKPYGKDESILNKEIVPNMVLIGLLMVVLTILVFQYYLPEGEGLARTGAFVTIAMTQLFNAFNLRTPHKSVFSIGIFSNKWIVIAFLASVIVQIAALNLPFMQKAFSFESLPLLDFLVITLLSSLVLWGGELYKYVKKKRQD